MKASWPGLLGAACAFGSVLPAQHVLEAETPLGQRPVVAVMGASPYILNAQGKPAPAPERLTVKRLSCFGEEAAVVHAANARLEPTALPAPDESAAALRYRADLTASRDLTSCYVVVWIERPSAETASPKTEKPARTSSRRGPGKHRTNVAVRELPDLVAGEKTSVDVVLSLPRAGDVAAATVMLFSGPTELLAAHLGPDHVAAERAKTRQHVLTQVSERPPAAYVRVSPRLPATLRGRGINAEALVRCRIDADGNVAEAIVESTSHPAFGEAAESAVREWKFLPAIENRQYVERSVVVPFHFQTPPAVPKAPGSSDSD
ncbi:MAG TPA: energy transducer TonB [Opitutaceae bacterium]|nr:energy transducer TonB [Opitutaceae bacterium]